MPNTLTPTPSEVVANPERGIEESRWYVVNKLTNKFAVVRVDNSNNRYIGYVDSPWQAFNVSRDVEMFQHYNPQLKGIDTLPAGFLNQDNDGRQIKEERSKCKVVKIDIRYYWKFSEKE
jgi:hypothetical protein